MKWLGLVLCVAACGDSPASGPTVRFTLPSSGLPAPLAVPFPSDIYLTDADGTIADTLTDWSLANITMSDPSALIANGYGVLDGFGRQSGAMFSIEGLAKGDAIDPATLADNTAVIDVETGAVVPASAGWDAFTTCIVVLPEDVLAAGHHYAAVVTSGVKTTNGHALGASAGFASIRGGKANAVYSPAIDAAVTAGFAKDKLVAVTAWTTMTDHRKLRPIRDALVAGTYGAAPTLLTDTVAAPYHYVRFGTVAHTGWTATLDEWLGAARKDASGNDLTGLPGGPEPMTTGFPHDALGAVISGAYVSPEFRRPFTMTADPADGTIELANGVAVAHDANAQVPVTIFLPKGPAPAGGFPVVIFQHGLGGQRPNAFAIANEFARAGIATAAIDAPWHGMRASGATDTASGGHGTYTGPDGFADSGNPLALLAMAGDLRNFTEATDNYFQAALDLAQLRRLISNCDLSALAAEYGGTAPTLDGTHVGLFGWSMGGAIATIFAGIEPRSSLDPVLIDAPGTALAKDVVDSAVYSQQTTLLAAQAGVPAETFSAGHYAASVQVLQGLLDRAEPGSFAEDIDHDLWMFRGNMDESVPARWSNSLARALGATQLTPTLGAVDRLPQGGSTLTGAKVVAFFEAGPATHGVLTLRFDKVSYEPPYPRDMDPIFVSVPAPYEIREPLVPAQRAVISFFQTTWAGAPAIDATSLAPVADSDDDSFCDNEDPAPFDPTMHPSGTGHCVRNVGFTFP